MRYKNVFDLSLFRHQQFFRLFSHLSVLLPYIKTYHQVIFNLYARNLQLFLFMRVNSLLHFLGKSRISTKFLKLDAFCWFPEVRKRSESKKRACERKKSSETKTVLHWVKKKLKKKIWHIFFFTKIMFSNYINFNLKLIWDTCQAMLFIGIIHIRFVLV